MAERGKEEDDATRDKPRLLIRATAAEGKARKDSSPPLACQLWAFYGKKLPFPLFQLGEREVGCLLLPPRLSPPFSPLPLPFPLLPSKKVCFCSSPPRFLSPSCKQGRGFFRGWGWRKLEMGKGEKGKSISLFSLGEAEFGGKGRKKIVGTCAADSFSSFPLLCDKAAEEKKNYR